jgi:hypothetical protein
MQHITHPNTFPESIHVTKLEKNFIKELKSARIKLISHETINELQMFLLEKRVGSK